MYIATIVNRNKSVELWAANPFSLADPAEREKARDHVLSLSLHEELRSHFARGNLRSGKQLLLAYGHAQASRIGVRPSSVLPNSQLPSALMRKLPRGRGAYLRIAMAAGRSYRAINELRGRSTAMADLRRDVWSACFGQSLLHSLELEQVIRDHDVLILGETGTGKESVAQAFLQSAPGPSTGAPAPTSALNAAAVPEALVESELFGHAKGAFTGATDARLGRLRSAAGGAFFLDEVGDLPSTTQVKLLRVIETDEVYPVGSDIAHRADLRYVAATHKDLEGMVQRGEFRQDLYGRLAGITLRIPPLRDRPEDISDIATGFVARYQLSFPSNVETKSVHSWLQSSEARNYGWPGNVRELQNVLRNLLLGLPPGLAQGTKKPKASVVEPRIALGTATLAEVRRWYLGQVLLTCDNNVSEAARRVGIDRSTLRRWLRKESASS